MQTPLEVVEMINELEKKNRPHRFISLGACTVDTILKVDRVPYGDVKVMAEDGVVIGAGMALSLRRVQWQRLEGR